MARKVGKGSRAHTEKLPDFVDAAYCLETDDQTWPEEVMNTASAVWGREARCSGTYDASDVHSLRIKNVPLTDFSDEGVTCIMEGLKLVTPDLVTRTFRSLLADSMSSRALPETLPMMDALGAMGFPDCLNLNGLDPSGLGYLSASGSENAEKSRPRSSRSTVGWRTTCGRPIAAAIGCAKARFIGRRSMHPTARKPTVRVLLARAATTLGVRTRAALLITPRFLCCARSRAPTTRARRP